MKKCEFEGCGRKTWKKSEYCIFHEPSKEKDADLFWKGLREMIGKHLYHFKGFFFIPHMKGYNINFGALRFEGGANFKDATFEGNVFFTNAEFLGNVKFDDAKFLKNASFDDVSFSGLATFNKATFFGNISFDEVKFSKESFFICTSFLKDVSFIDTIFNEETLFIGTKFSNDNRFEWAKFFKNVIFDDAIFSHGANFSWVEFYGDASFGRTEFSAMTSFHLTSFNACDFINTKFKEVDFKHVIFKNLEQARFYHTDLSKATFSPTSGLERIDFLNPKWAGEKRKEIFLGDDHLGTTDIDERYSELETMYRQLKRNYENKRNYPDAGDFYIGEMEMRRKNRKTSWLERKMILPFYKYVSNYGEDYKRALCWIGGLIFLSASSLMFTGMKVKERFIDYYPSLPQNPNGLKDFGELVNIVGRSIILQSSTFAESTSLGSRIILTLTTILGILFIALFTLALRRRFRR